MPNVPIVIRTEIQKAVFQVMKAYEGALVQTYVAAMTKFASLVIRGAFILNGTVGVAAFASGNTGSSYPVFLCSLGALFALLSSCFAFLAQRRIFVLELYIHYEETIVALAQDISLDETMCHLQKHKNAKVWYKNFWFFLCALCIAFSIGLFCYGLYQTMQIYQIEISA